MKKALLFDYGGTLDTGGVHWGKVLWKAYQHANLPVQYEDFQKAYVFAERTLGTSKQITPEDTFRQVLEKKIALQFQCLNQKTLSEDSRKRLVEECYQVALNHTRQSKQVLDVLKRKYRMVLVSNFYGNLRTVLEEFALSECFDDVVESAKVGVRKPDAEIFAMAMHRSGLRAEECVVIGDSLKNDINSARILHIDTVWLCNEGWEDTSTQVKHTIHSIEELLNIL